MARIENPPLKPYLARGAGVLRCDVCRLPVKSCICAFREEVVADVEFVVLMHRNESYKPTNTGRLIEASIANTRNIQWHSRLEPGAQLGALLSDPAYQPIIVFPPSDAYQHRMISKPKEGAGKPLFILLDGTWRQARRMFLHSVYLQKFPVISLDEVRKSTYALRKAAHEGQLCTAEVAAALLHQIGEVEAGDALNRYYQRFNANYIASRRRWAKRDSSTGELHSREQ
ncbi:MAG: DTW domain-containing protein [Oceanospirillaceae bacterium]|nr:DTW domain-containing protein [Oceanospirillaceae bacterium]